MKLLFAASGWEALVTLFVIVTITIISSWLKKKQQAEEDSDSWPQRPAAPRPPMPQRRAPGQPEAAPPSQPASWEEELRRLLQGEPEEAPPPPVIIRPAPQPSRTPPPIPRAQPARAPHLDEQDVGLPVKLSGLTQSVEAYRKASQLDKKVEQHLRGVEQRVVAHAPAQQLKTSSPELERVRAMMHGRESIRSAVIASVILGPPKASAC